MVSGHARSRRPRPAPKRGVVTAIRMAAGLAVLATGLALVVGAGAATPPSGKTLLDEALVDALARGSVHELSVAAQGSRRSVFDDDVAIAEGRQSIVVHGQVPGQVIRARVMVTKGSAYVSGNETAIQHYFGFPAAAAGTVGARWISVPRTDSWYPTVATDATLPSALADLGIPSNPTVTAPTTESGTQVVGLHAQVRKGSVSVSATLYVTRGAHPLPVTELVHVKQGGATSTGTITFSSWGEPVHLTAPAGTIPVASLGR
jgi:hypothetical protein